MQFSSSSTYVGLCLSLCPHGVYYRSLWLVILCIYLNQTICAAGIHGSASRRWVAASWVSERRDAVGAATDVGDCQPALRQWSDVGNTAAGAVCQWSS